MAYAMRQEYIGRERVKERVHRQENIISAEGRVKNQDHQSADAGLPSSYYSLKKAYQRFYFFICHDLRLSGSYPGCALRVLVCSAWEC